VDALPPRANRSASSFMARSLSPLATSFRSFHTALRLTQSSELGYYSIYHSGVLGGVIGYDYGKYFFVQR
ncbi:hypothetical protein J6590_047262, partial [Homalodisca vitripennis]